MLRIVNDILSALDNGNISVLLLLDLSAAFDTIDHQILLSRLNSVFGIQSIAQSIQSMVSVIPLRQISVHFSQSLVFVTITDHVRCASGLSTWAHSLRPVHYASLRYQS